eukprot:2880787-Rhodomonas_salina.1
MSGEASAVWGCCEMRGCSLQGPETRVCVAVSVAASGQRKAGALAVLVSPHLPPLPTLASSLFPLLTDARLAS